MILVGLGSNLTSESFMSSKEIIEAALSEFSGHKINVIQKSQFYETEPVPKSDQPWFVNMVVKVETNHNPQELLNNLHNIELKLGRIRKKRWEARVIDLDLLCYNEVILPNIENWQKTSRMMSYSDPIIPHGRLHERNFVLIPILDISKKWKHPIFKKTAQQMVDENKSEEIVRILR